MLSQSIVTDRVKEGRYYRTDYNFLLLESKAPLSSDPSNLGFWLIQIIHSYAAQKQFNKVWNQSANSKNIVKLVSKKNSILIISADDHADKIDNLFA